MIKSLAVLAVLALATPVYAGSIAITVTTTATGASDQDLHHS